MGRSIQPAYVPVFLALGVLGCAQCRVQMHPEVDQSGIDSIAVLDFDDSARATDAGWTMGVVVPEGSGRIVAALVRAALAEQGQYRVMPEREMTEKLRQRQRDRADAGLAGQEAELGKVLGVDAVVAGRVERYAMTYKLVIQRAHVRAAFWCIETRTAARCWDATLSASRGFAHERDLADRTVRACVARLAKAGGG